MGAEIVFTEMDRTWEPASPALASAFPGARVRTFTETAQAVAGQIRDAEILSVFIKSRLDRPLLESLPRLKLIATRSTGYDHIDLAAAKEKGVQVLNVPTYGENTVAEHTFALILSLSRNLRKSYLKTQAGDFSLDGLIGFDLKGKTLGVVGTGHIGLHVIRIGVAFGMKVIAFDLKEQKFLSEVMSFEYVPFEELMKRSDIISLHVPYLPSTRHLINRETLRLVKEGAILINTARGGLIETHALVDAVNEGRISGVGLDVLEEEELILEDRRLLGAADSEAHWESLRTTLKNHLLLHRENVIFTPHLAFYSREAVQRIIDTTLENIRDFLRGSEPARVK
ncbi:MAG: hydroxyacid dehydrogenase [Candidatus Omnitrophica bacterium]|nr:hydroxyacid dehydrogenase [Candidatus Omnitrophota bacterium]